jgi:hypothetical protein
MMAALGTGNRLPPRIHSELRGGSPPHPPDRPGVAIGNAQFAELIDCRGHLDLVDRAAEKLISLTIRS